MAVVCRFPADNEPTARRSMEPDMRHTFIYDLDFKTGDKGIRTPDLTGAIRALYQLSYIPTAGQQTADDPL